MRQSVLCLLTASWLLGCSLTVRNPRACLFEGPSVCPAGTSCDPLLNECVPSTDGGTSPTDLQCSGYFCNDSPSSLAASQLFGVWGTSPSDIWAISYPNSIVHWDGQSWHTSKAASGPALYTIAGLGANNIWVVGDNGTVYRWDGASWTQQAVPSTTNFYGIWVENASQVWVAGNQGLIYRGDGVNWNLSLMDGTYGNFLSLSGVDPQHIWAVSNMGRIAAWNGVAWSMTVVGGGSLRAVSAQAPDNVWTVGVGSLAFRFDGTSWKSQPAGTVSTPVLNSVWTVDADTAWAVGDGGSIFKWYRSAWNLQTSPTASDLNGVWSAPGQQTWIVGNNGTVLHQAEP
ncbi:MAG TPA: hypothetical protein PLW65_10005 [Pseudomonadota bacterium]|nr:hypothetical protein [Pseudomonadota bacterium]